MIALAVVIVLACSYGFAQCGASDNGDDLTRPQDLHTARVYENCMNSGPSGTMQEITNHCTHVAHITYVLEYTRGPLVYIATGKPGHVRVLHKR